MSTESTQPAPDDLVSVKEAAAAAIGMKIRTVNAWIGNGTVMAWPGPQGRRVSLSVLQALLAPSDPLTPADTRPVFAVAPLVGVSRTRVHAWIRQGRVPSWPGRNGRLVRVTDVQALANEQRGRVATTSKTEE